MKRRGHCCTSDIYRCGIAIEIALGENGAYTKYKYFCKVCANICRIYRTAIFHVLVCLYVHTYSTHTHTQTPSNKIFGSPTQIFVLCMPTVTVPVAGTDSRYVRAKIEENR